MVGCISELSYIQCKFSINPGEMRSDDHDMIYRMTKAIPIAAVLILSFLTIECTRNTSDQFSHALNDFTRAQHSFQERKYQTALEQAKATLPTFLDLGVDSTLSDNYFLAGECYNKLGQYSNALGSFQLASEHARRIGDRARASLARNVTAESYYRLRDFASAARLADEAAAEAKIFGDRSGERAALRIAARAYMDEGSFERSLKVLEVIDAFGQADSLGALSEPPAFRLKFDLFRMQRDVKRAGETFQRWRDYLSASNDRAGFVEAYRCWGEFQQALGRFDSALRAYRFALTKIATDSAVGDRIELLAELGAVSYRLERYEGAKQYFNEALTWGEQGYGAALKPMIELMLLACSWKNDPESVSSDDEERILNIARSADELSNDGTRAFALMIFGKIEDRRNNISLALKQYDQAIKLYEKHPTLYPAGSVQFHLVDAFLDREKIDWYDPAIALRVSLGSAAEVVAMIESRKLRNLITFFSELSLPLQNETAWRAIVSVQWMRHGLMLLQQDRFAAMDEGIAGSVEQQQALQTEYRARVDDYTAAFGKLEHVDSNIRWLVAPGMISIKNIQENLPEGSLLLEYLPMPSALQIIAITRDSVVMRKTIVQEKYIETLSLEYSRRLAGEKTGSGTAPIGELSAILHRVFIAPVEQEVARASRLYIVPPVEFAWMPFHTLTASIGYSNSNSGNTTGGRRVPLGVETSVRYLPSAAALLFNNDEAIQVKSVAGIGFPGRSAWDVEYELKDIRSFYEKAKLFFDTAATISHLGGGGFDLLHIAAEVEIDAQFPLRSSVTLSDGTIAFGSANVPIANLLAIAPPPVVVFSSVSRSAGELDRYIPMLLLAGGSKMVIGTMWQGERRPKRYFGEVFYTQLAGGMPAGRAFDQAISSVARNPEYGSPGRWGLYYAFGK